MTSTIVEHVRSPHRHMATGRGLHASYFMLRPQTGRYAATLTIFQRKEEARVAAERKKLAWQRDHAYDDIMTEDNLAESSNQDRDEDFLDDFM
jgi:hypothetical protein